MQSQLQTVLGIATRTWSRDSHDLFDYEAKQVDRKSFFVQVSSRCSRAASTISFVPEDKELRDGEYLLRVVQREDKYWVMPPERLPHTSTVKKMWMIVKDLPNNQHILTEGDVVKLGRFRLRVKQICVSESAGPLSLKLDESEPPLLKEPIDPERQQCRICLLEGGPGEEPLVAPCMCKGSIEYVHVGCLRHWVSAKQQTSATDTEGCFYYRQPLCELCRTVLPHAIRVQPSNEGSNMEDTMGGEAGNRGEGRKGEEEFHQIVTVPAAKAPFIVLESMAFQGHQQRGVHVLSLGGEQKVLKLGRGHESEIRIPDVSISRFHASLRFVDDKFYLEDHNSKFGTLVLVKKAIPVLMDRPVVVQVGRTVIEANLRPISQVPLARPLSIVEVDEPQVEDAVDPNASTAGAGEGSVSLGGMQEPDDIQDSVREEGDSNPSSAVGEIVSPILEANRILTRNQLLPNPNGASPLFNQERNSQRDPENLSRLPSLTQTATVESPHFDSLLSQRPLSLPPQTTPIQQQRWIPLQQFDSPTLQYAFNQQQSNSSIPGGNLAQLPSVKKSSARPASPSSDEFVSDPQTNIRNSYTPLELPIARNSLRVQTTEPGVLTQQQNVFRSALDLPIGYNNVPLTLYANPVRPNDPRASDVFHTLIQQRLLRDAVDSDHSVEDNTTRAQRSFNVFEARR